MKPLITLLLFLVTLNVVTQESPEQIKNFKNTKSNRKHTLEAFSPDKRLLNEEIWQRVSVNRFECDFLRLAVELSGNEYLLYEMDGNKRLLIRHEQYSMISKAIAKLTLRTSSPYFIRPPKIN